MNYENDEYQLDENEHHKPFMDSGARFSSVSIDELSSIITKGTSESKLGRLVQFMMEFMDLSTNII